MERTALCIRHNRFSSKFAAFVLALYCFMAAVFSSGIRDLCGAMGEDIITETVECIRGEERAADARVISGDQGRLAYQETFRNMLPPAEYGQAQSRYQGENHVIVRLPQVVLSSLIRAVPAGRAVRILISGKIHLPEFLVKIQSVHLNR